MLRKVKQRTIELMTQAVITVGVPSIERTYDELTFVIADGASFCTDAIRYQPVPIYKYKLLFEVRYALSPVTIPVFAINAGISARI